MTYRNSMRAKMHITNVLRIAFIVALALAGYWGVEKQSALVQQSVNLSTYKGQAEATTQKVEALLRASAGAARTTTWWIIGLTLAGSFLIWYGGILLIDMIGKPLLRGIDIAERVAAGDLTTEVTEVTRLDEAGQLMRALEKMNGSLVRMARAVRASTQSIAQASGTMSMDSDRLAKQAQQEAAALDETTRSVESMSQAVSLNAEHAAQAKQLAESASGEASDAGAVVTQAVGTVQGISHSAEKIAEITSVIDGIAFQTNILALNAAVEAARAGEQGRGFAVVASEIRALAHRSATAAKEIKSLIDSSLTQVRTGNELVSLAGRKMQGTVDAVRRLAVLINDIALASNEQAAGIREVNQTVTHLDQVVQQNAIVASRASGTATALEKAVHDLQELCSRFKFADGPDDAPVLVRPPRSPINAQTVAATSRAIATSKAPSDSWSEF